MKRVSTILALCVILFSCRSPQFPPPDVVDCPPPPVAECVQLKSSQAPFDTNSSNGFAPATYWKIDVVKGLNTSDDERALCFFDSRNAILTRGASTQAMFATHVPRADSAAPGKTIDAFVNGQAGIASLHAGSITYSSYPYGNVSGDADILTGRYSAGAIRDTQRLALSQAIDWDAHPAFSPDGKVLFFASERAGGFGGSDIWFVRKLKDGTWSPATNAGASINTPCDELSPFVSIDSKSLLFASTGWEGFGGYDIFSSTISSEFFSKSVAGSASGSFAKALNIGAPLNTKADELFPSSPTAVNELLYYSSNQREANFHIYVRHRLTYGSSMVVAQNEEKIEDDFSSIDEDKVELRGKVYNNRKETVKGADIKARDVEANKTVARTKTDSVGEYTIEVPLNKTIEVSAQHESGFFDSYKVNTKTSDTSIVLKHDFVVPEVLFLRVNFPRDVYDQPYKNVLDSNGIETNQQWNESLDLLAENLKKYSASIKRVVLVGHTDEYGTAEYNQALGQRRVDFVISELAKRGINKEILEGRSAGKTELLLRRKNENSDTYYKRNRRVELSKLKK